MSLDEVHLAPGELGHLDVALHEFVRSVNDRTARVMFPVADTLDLASLAGLKALDRARLRTLEGHLLDPAVVGNRDRVALGPASDGVDASRKFEQTFRHPRNVCYGGLPRKHDLEAILS